MPDKPPGSGHRRTGSAFWREKLAANKARDRLVTRTLRRQGWRVVRIWEHELAKNPQRCVEKIKKALASGPGIANPGTGQ